MLWPIVLTPMVVLHVNVMLDMKVLVPIVVTLTNVQKVFTTAALMEHVSTVMVTSLVNVIMDIQVTV